MKTKNILALDFGERKIGLAFKKSGYTEVDIIGNFKNQGDVLNKVLSLMKEKSSEYLVIGYPLSSDGGKTEIAIKVDRFAKALRSCISPKIGLWLQNEYNSSQEAANRLRFLGKNEKFIEKNIHSYSAVIILERFLESKKG